MLVFVSSVRRGCEILTETSEFTRTTIKPKETSSMKIYTKHGDKGQTGLIGGVRVSKDDARIEAYGTVDELSSALGVARSLGSAREISDLLAEVQNKLFTIGALLATPPDKEAGTELSAADIQLLEQSIDRFDASLPPLTEFVLPAGTAAAAALHQARTVCRRAERRVVSLACNEGNAEGVVAYLNRLGDLLFVLARAANHAAGVADVTWKK